jgi:hypothetical protein
MKYSAAIIIFLLSHCHRRAITTAPLPASGQVVRSYVDTLYDTLRYYAKLTDTVRLERTVLALRYDTLRNLVQIAQVVKTPIRSDTVRLTQYVITQTSQPATTPPPRGLAWWVWALVGAGAVIAILLLLKLK